MRVSARRAAIVAGLMAGVYLVVLFSVRRVPDRVLRAVGGPHGVARDGGLILRYRPPASYDAAKLDASAERHGVKIEREAGVLVVEVPGIAEAEASQVATILTHRGLELREVISGSSLADFRRFVAPDVDVFIDQWDGQGTLASRTCAYLSADNPVKLTDAFVQVRAHGWVQPPHSIIAYEHIEPWRGSTDRDTWRSYVLGDEVLLDGDAVDIARPNDPGIGRATVWVDLDRAGGKRFGEITARLVDHKLAALVAGQVRSAPIIRSAIRDGHVSIALDSGGNGERYEREAAALAAALESIALPPGGTIESQTWIPTASITGVLILSRLVIGLLGGALIAMLIGIVIRVTRPAWQPGPLQPSGRFPIRRAAVTLLAPVALLALGPIPLPGFDRAAQYSLFDGVGMRDHIGIIGLGIVPIVVAHLLIELSTLVMPRWRRVRFDPAARIEIGRRVAITGVVLALIQSHFVVGYLVRNSFGGSDLGLLVHVAAMASLTTGTLLLVIVAGMIRQHGLGNGYGALFLSGWVIVVAQQVLDDSHAGAQQLPPGWNDGYQLGLATFAAIGCATVAMLRMRVGEDREAPLRVPSSGHVPLFTAVTVIGLWSLAREHVLSSTSVYVGTMANAIGAGWYLVGALVVLVPVWSFAFSRREIVAPLAARTQLAPSSRASWRRATLLSLVILLFITAASLASALTSSTALPVGDAILTMIAAAVALDIADDLQARRIDLVAVWPLQHAQHAELVRRVLTDAGIQCHLQSSHLRCLLAFFGPYVPIDVLVPAAAAEDARARIEPLFQDTAVVPTNALPVDHSVGSMFARALRPPAGG